MPALLCPILLSAALAAEPAPAPPPADPFLRQYAETRGFRAGRPTAVQLSPDGRAALFLRSGPRSRAQALLETDLATGATRRLVEADGAGALTPEEAARLERQRITGRGITHFVLSRDGAHVVYGLGGRLWLLDRAAGRAAPLPGSEGALDPRFSPDGRALAYVKRGDLYVRAVPGGTERRLTRARGRDVTNGLAEFVAQEEMDRDEGYWWSPDGRRIAYAEVDESAVERRMLCDPARPARPCEARAYPRAGTPNAAVRLKVVAVAGGRAVEMRWDAARYPYLAAVRWARGGPLALVVQDRLQKEERVLAADPATGRTRTLLVERDDAWLDLWPGMPAFLPDGRFWWVTERGGAPEVELRAADGARLEVSVPRALGYAAFAGVEGGALVFAGAPDPTREELYRVRPGTPPERLALGEPGPATRRAALAPGGGTLAVTWSTLRRLPVTAVFGADGSRLAVLPSVAEEPAFVPTTELRQLGGADGIRAAVLRPRALGAGARLPVVVEVYGGPVPAWYVPQVAHRPMLIEQWLADQGFLVAVFDGRGTPRRGRDWERAIAGDLGTVPLEDQVAALEALGREVPEADVARAGITGWSFGGYLAALAVMRRPDRFRAAVAGAPVVDWEQYDTHYTERYLGLPGEHPEAYARSGLLAWAPRLDRPLLLLHGTADDNVFLSHSLALADALFLAGRPFELVPIAGATHSVPDPLAAERRWEWTAGFFRRALGAVRPGPALAPAP
ncbi:DPP IV N-terminal domain-containing protein [Anaeromyxobacter sp. Red801]|uniref:DPP IV N-terminal domain-containing protein n=1 Tax=Anaeromyxobacter sp. Red801 TaxID=3411632 RepID=UPI003BA11713